MIKKSWIIKDQGNTEGIASLQNALGISKPIASLLFQRDIKTFEQAKIFFRPELDHLHDPYLMKDMDKAVARICRALESNESLLVYGDYDVDGTTSVAMVYSYFKNSFKKIDYYIPDRYTEGYGISFKGIDYAAANGFRLIIALDCGIKSTAKVRYARDRGVEFIICDHHNPGPEIPDAEAVLDPKQAGCNYPYKELSGCGVGFKLLQAFHIKQNLPLADIYKYLDLVAVSIASDIVPITGENRVMAFYGLKQINKDPSTGLKAIIKMSGIEGKKIEIEDIVFKIGPRINAAGRMESGKKSVDLLISDNVKDAQVMSEKINVFNTDRRNIDAIITQEALSMIQADPRSKNCKSTVLFSPEWHKGVIGIVASRLLDHYYRPTVILTRSNGFATGSARSVSGFDLYQAIEGCSSLLENFGGHKFAAGLTLKVQNVQAFREKFEEIVCELIQPDQLIPVVTIDTELPLSEINDKLFRILQQFQPFGPENMAPVFLTENVSDNGGGKLVGLNGEHLKLSLVQEQDPYKVFPAIAFQRGGIFPKISDGHAFDIVYSLEENVYRGGKCLQLNIKDIKTD